MLPFVIPPLFCRWRAPEQSWHSRGCSPGQQQAEVMRPAAGDHCKRKAHVRAGAPRPMRLVQTAKQQELECSRAPPRHPHRRYRHHLHPHTLEPLKRPGLDHPHATGLQAERARKLAGTRYDFAAATQQQRTQRNHVSATSFNDGHRVGGCATTRHAPHPHKSRCCG